MVTQNCHHSCWLEFEPSVGGSSSHQNWRNLCVEINIHINIYIRIEKLYTCHNSHVLVYCGSEHLFKASKKTLKFDFMNSTQPLFTLGFQTPGEEVCGPQKLTQKHRTSAGIRKTRGLWHWTLRLMAEILNQLRLVVYPIICFKGFIRLRWCRISSINHKQIQETFACFFMRTQSFTGVNGSWTAVRDVVGRWIVLREA